MLTIISVSSKAVHLEPSKRLACTANIECSIERSIRWDLYAAERRSGSGVGTLASPAIDLVDHVLWKSVHIMMSY